jgi:thiamine-monophosphate kinase
VLGIGDDAAILKAHPDSQWVVSTDTLVCGTHFHADDPANTIGHKSLAVNFSDLAAMGATPKWVLLNLTLPEINEAWISDFVSGFSGLLNRHQAQLIGGDTTRGPSSIGVTVMGECQQAIRRDTAGPDQLVVVTGHMGSAAFALHHPKASAACLQQLRCPEPRLDVSPAISEIATAMIDVSDGLLADLGHICERSGIGAELKLEQVPSHPDIHQSEDWPQYVLSGGDDYQLCFTISPEDEHRLPAGCSVIGRTLKSSGITVLYHQQPIHTGSSGYQHFAHE